MTVELEFKWTPVNKDDYWLKKIERRRPGIRRRLLDLDVAVAELKCPCGDAVRLPIDRQTALKFTNKEALEAEVLQGLSILHQARYPNCQHRGVMSEVSPSC